MDKRMSSTAMGTRNVKVEGWYCETEGLAVLGSLYCSVHATSLCSSLLEACLRTKLDESTGGKVCHRQTKHCQGWVQWGKSQILKSPLFFPDLGHTMKNNCAETWRETGCGAGSSFSILKAQLSPCAQCPALSTQYWLIKASQENHPRKQKAVHLKRKKSKVKRTGWEECYVSQLPPLRLGMLLKQEAASTEHWRIIQKTGMAVYTIHYFLSLSPLL